MCGVVRLMVYFEMGIMGRLVCHACSLSPDSERGARGRLVCVYVACPQESKARFLGEGLFCRVFVTVS